MATIIERDVHHHSDGTNNDASSAMTVLIMIVAIAVIAGLALFALRAYPFNSGAPATGSNPVDINVEGTIPVNTNPNTPQQ